MLGSESKLIEKTNVLPGLADMFAVMYPQLQGIDALGLAGALSTAA